MSKKVAQAACVLMAGTTALAISFVSAVSASGQEVPPQRVVTEEEVRENRELQQVPHFIWFDGSTSTATTQSELDEEFRQKKHELDEFLRTGRMKNGSYRTASGQTAAELKAGDRGPQKAESDRTKPAIEPEREAGR